MKMIRRLSFLFGLVASVATGAIAQPRLEVSPARVLIGDSVSLRVTGLAAGDVATLHVQSVALNESGAKVPFYGRASFLADATGAVDIASVAPVRGYYSGADLRGLFWSQRPLAHDADGRAAIASLGLDDPSSVGVDEEVLTLEKNGTVLDRKVLTLSDEHPDVIRKDVRENGLVGVFYCEKGSRKRPVVVILGGAEGGLTFADIFGPKLASRGYAVFGLAYFAPQAKATDGVPTALNRIPVEILEKARRWLSTRPEVNIRRFGLVGASKGGEFTLVLASTYKWIDAAVAYVPSDVVWQGFQYGVSEERMGSSWTRDGRDLPFLPQTGQRQEILRGRQPGAAPIELARVAAVNRAAATPAALAAATIPIERSRAALLLIGGGDDMTGDSGASVERLAARLKRAAYPRPHEILVYPGAGHGIVGTGWRPTTTYNTGVFNDGGTPEADARAQADSWVRMLEFLKRSLRP